MDVSKIQGDPKATIIRLVEPFFQQGTSPVFVASCCGRLYAGSTTPKLCRKCGRSPAAVAFGSLAEVDIEKVPDQPT